MEECRAHSLNKTVIAEFFEMLREIIEKFNIPPENIYNMDKKGIQIVRHTKTTRLQSRALTQK